MKSLSLVLALLAGVLVFDARGNYLFPYPVGGRETLLANTGVVGPPDSTGLFYNPARLSGLGEGDFSLQGSIYGLEHSESRFLSTKAVHSRTSAVPHSLLVSGRYFSVPLTFGVLSPTSFDRFQTIVTQEGAEQIAVSLATRKQDLWLGVGTGFSVGDRVSVGAAVFLIRHGQEVLAFAGSKKNDLTSLSASYLSEQRSVLVGAISLGALMSVSPGWSVGARVQTPSLKLHGRTDLDTRGFSFSAGPGASSFELPEKEVTAHYQLPALVTVGTRYESDPVALSLAVGYFPASSYPRYLDAPSYREIESEPAGAKITAGVEWRYDADLLFAAGFALPYLADKVIVARTFSATAGMERSFSNFTARTGLFYSHYALATDEASYRLVGISFSGTYRL